MSSADYFEHLLSHSSVVIKNQGQIFLNLFLLVLLKLVQKPSAQAHAGVGHAAEKNVNETIYH